MPNGIQHCASHDEVVRIAGRSLQVAEEHGKQLSNIFEKLGEIQTSVDQNYVRAEHRDEALADLQVCVNTIDEKIENGLKAEIAAAAKNVRELKACMEQRKIIRDENAKTGIRGFVTMGWIKFRDQASFLLVTGTIIISVWLLLWITAKMAIFHESPEKLLKFFGVG